MTGALIFKRFKIDEFAPKGVFLMIKFSEIKIFVGAVNVPSLGQWFTLPVSPSRVTQVLTEKARLDQALVTKKS